MASKKGVVRKESSETHMSDGMGALHVAECLRWSQGRLVVSEMADGALVTEERRVGLKVDGALSCWVGGSGSCGDGSRLVVRQANSHAEVLRLWPSIDAQTSMHASLDDYCSYSSRTEFPNDAVADADGNLYVGVCSGKTHLSLSGKIFAPTTPLLLVRPDGGVLRAAEGLCFPNGMVITPDGKTLIVAETFYESGTGAKPPMLTAFDRDLSTGSLSNRRVWARLPTLCPDGITLDREGCIWIAACFSSRVPVEGDQLSDPDGSCFPKNFLKWSGFVRVAQGGKCTGVVHLQANERQALSCTLGGTEAEPKLFMATIRKNTIRHKQKNGCPVFEPLPASGNAVIREIPLPVGASQIDGDSRYCAGCW